MIDYDLMTDDEKDDITVRDMRNHQAAHYKISVMVDSATAARAALGDAPQVAEGETATPEQQAQLDAIAAADKALKGPADSLAEEARIIEALRTKMPDGARVKAALARMGGM